MEWFMGLEEKTKEACPTHAPPQALVCPRWNAFGHAHCGLASNRVQESKLPVLWRTAAEAANQFLVLITYAFSGSFGLKHWQPPIASGILLPEDGRAGMSRSEGMAQALPWWWRHCPQCCGGWRGAILGTMTTRPGTCRGGAFACWHSAWPSCLEQAG